MFVGEMAADVRDHAPDAPLHVVVARFVLPKGGYATTVLGAACRIIDVSRGESAEETGEDP